MIMTSNATESTPDNKAVSDQIVPVSPTELLEEEIDRFIEHVGSLEATLPFAVVAMNFSLDRASQEYDSFILEHCTVESTDDGDLIRFDADLQGRFHRLRSRRDKARLAYRLVPRSLLVSLISQFDAFVGGLVRVYYTIHPESLNSVERSLTLGQLNEFGSIEAAKAYILEKEVESVLRKSHSEQFDWMEGKFGIPLRSDLHSWPNFVELTERRNLFVHTNGIVSSQYLNVCRKHGVVQDNDLEVGTTLPISPEYFQRAYDTILEIGVKLGHVFWRKMLPQARAEADDHFIAATYGLLGDGEYDLAKNLLDFGTLTLKKHSTDHVRRVLIVNRAQAYKWSGDEKKAREIITREDWSAANDQFRLASAVIRDDFEEALALIKRIGAKSAPSKTDYLEWPLFQELRKREDFAAVFESVFGEPFNVLAKQTLEATASLPGGSEEKIDAGVETERLETPHP